MSLTHVSLASLHVHCYLLPHYNLSRVAGNPYRTVEYHLCIARLQVCCVFNNNCAEQSKHISHKGRSIMFMSIGLLKATNRAFKRPNERSITMRALQRDWP